MKIQHCHLQIRRIPLLRTFRTALREVREIEEIVVTLETETGLQGHGAACPAPPITGENLAGIEATIRDKISPAIVGMDLRNFDRVVNAIATATAGNSSAKAAVDMALYDLWSRWLEKPLYQLLGGYRNTLETNLTLSLDTPEKMAQAAQEAVAEGFSILKVKIGGIPQQDIERVAAVRTAVGSDIRLRLDANQGWTTKDAIRVIRRLEEFHPELVEQPVAAADRAGLRQVTTSVDVPVMADEAAFSPRDVVELLASRSADIINIKLLKCGGISQALKIVAIAEAFGVECMLGCMMEGPTSLALAIHLAAAKKNITRYDLDTLFFAESALREELPGICYGPRISFTDGR